MPEITSDEVMMSLQKAFNEIHFYRGVVPYKAYGFLIDHQTEVTPRLIQVLKNVIQRHDRTGNYYVAHIHALLLLSQFREKMAYSLVIELLSLPIDSIDRLLGDLLTESITKIITSVYDGNSELLFSLLLNHETNATVRSIIGGCFSALIYQKMINKEMVTLRLQEIVASGKMNEDQAFFTALANMTMECKLGPLYDTCRSAFNVGMVDISVMDIHFFEKSLSKPIDLLIREEDLNPLTDAAKELAKWYNDAPITPIIEHNALCPCGSGHKFKKCCIDHL